MKSAKLLNIFYPIIAVALSLTVLVNTGGFIFTADAETEKAYCADTYTADGYNGEGEQTDASYYVYYDYKEDTIVKHLSVPSFGNGDTSLKNTCAPLTAMNIITFYDRWYDELVPDYTAGVQYPDNRYFYYPDMAGAATRNVITNLYGLMKTGETGGTTSANFKSGLNTYVTDAGYSLNSTSFYGDSASVNLDKLTSAINQNKVGLIMCDTYNFVSSISTNSDGTADFINQRNSNAAHMMMVYGYRTIEYFKDNASFRKETFLFVCSSYSSGVTGYIRLNDYLSIDEAWIMTVS